MGNLSRWLSEACTPADGRAPRLLRSAGDGGRAALVEVTGHAGLGSHVRVAPAQGGAWQDVAVFDGRVEVMEWQGEDLLLGFAAGDPTRVLSLLPGLRLREAAGPGGLRWMRISTRRSRR